MQNQSARGTRDRSGRRSGRRVFSSSRPSHNSNRFSHDRSGGNFRRRGGSNRGGASGRGRKLPTFDPSQFINKNPISVDKTDITYTPTHLFTDFGLDKRLAKLVAEAGLTAPSPIQDGSIPHSLVGRDVIGLAETGTGKTAAFLLPLIHKTLQDNNRQSLIITPTRELAIQIQAELRKFSRGLAIHSVVCVGGTNIRPQISVLRRHNHFIIGTPGRLLDLIKRGSCRLDKVAAVVLDEADRMLDMGFIHDMKSILEKVPKERQTLFFSATMSKDIEKLTHDFLREPVTVSVKKKDVTDSIKQDVVRHSHHNKFETLSHLLKGSEFNRVLIFGAMKHSVEKLARELTRNGLPAESIHGNKSHGQRQRALERFKRGAVKFMVATDVAARGIHVDAISHVINYDLPNTFEDYVHRIGRTGRALEKGVALTFVPE